MFGELWSSQLMGYDAPGADRRRGPCPSPRRSRALAARVSNGTARLQRRRCQESPYVSSDHGFGNVFVKGEIDCVDVLLVAEDSGGWRAGNCVGKAEVRDF